MLGLLGLRIFEACGANIDNLGEEHGHRVLKIHGKGDKTVLIPLPPAVARAIDRAVDGRDHGPILRNAYGVRMDRHAATRRLKLLADGARIRIARMHPHMLRHIVRDDHARRRCQPAQGADRRPARRPTNDHALRPGPQEPRPAPQLHSRRLHGIRHLITQHAKLPMSLDVLFRRRRPGVKIVRGLPADADALLVSETVDGSGAGVRPEGPRTVASSTPVRVSEFPTEPPGSPPPITPRIPRSVSL